MDPDQINRLITDEVDKIEDKDIKKFIREILSHERQHMNREKYQYKQKYNNLISEYALEDEWHVADIGAEATEL